MTGSTDAILYSHTKGYLQTAGRLAFHIGPLMAMAASFSATSCVAQSLRNKDDATNYVLGGFSSGAIFGIWMKSARAGIYSSVMLGTFACLKKMSVDEGWELFPEPKNPERSLFDKVKYDYSALKDK
jgi:NADH dehydrogenase (ubiquinone) 1 alpha subcomplex subunit 11